MSDATLRELERAAREDTAGQAWARLALGRARAGLDGRRAAVQALLKDPAAPVRELLPRDDVPAPRALGAELEPLRVPTGILRQPPADLVDLGRGRALLVARDELVAVDLFAGEVLWRRARAVGPGWLGGPTLVGERIVELHDEGRGVRAGWSSADTGKPAGRLTIPDLQHPDPRCVRLVALGGGRCALVVWAREWQAVWLDLEAGRVLGATALPDQNEPEVADLLAPDAPQHQAADGALVVGREGTLEAREADGRLRWSHATGGEWCGLLAAGGGLVAARVSGGPRVDVVSADAGRPLCSVPVEAERALLAGQLLVVVEPEPGGRERLVAFAARTGERRWRSEAGFLLGHDLALHAAGDVLVAVRSLPLGPDRTPRVMETTALDRETGATLWSRRAEDDEVAVRPIGGLLVAIAPPSGWILKHTPLRRVAPA